MSTDITARKQARPLGGTARHGEPALAGAARPPRADLLAAPSGEAALRMAEERDRAIDVLITDILTSGMAGPELVERVRSMHRRSR